MFKKWDDLPDFMKCDEVRAYYAVLSRKRIQLLVKRVLDYGLAILLLMLFFIPMFIIAMAVKLDSKGPVIFRQERVTSYGKRFTIHKFRTMDDKFTMPPV